MTWKQYLTEKVLKECWHTESIRCERCGKYHNEPFNRTFDNIQDLHDVYSALYRAGKWREYSRLVWCKWYPQAELFCLNGKSEDFEARCRMVAEWHGWEEDSDV